MAKVKSPERIEKKSEEKVRTPEKIQKQPEERTKSPEKIERERVQTHSPMRGPIDVEIFAFEKDTIEQLNKMKCVRTCSPQRIAAQFNPRNVKSPKKSDDVFDEYIDEPEQELITY